ncbi:hypothetical protein HanIR_Chr17g0863501 [Helianthus annuus]|nr:hypothetical protein HanIR_Chr17g0863501 [Helianthus annuus]
MMDPIVTLFGSVHEKQNETGSMIFPNFGSMFHGDQHKPDNWDVESNHENGNLSVDETNDNVKTPLLSLNSTSVDKDMIAPVSRSMLNTVQPSESNSVIGIGGGWQLAYTKTEDRRREESGRVAADLLAPGGWCRIQTRVHCFTPGCRRR